MSEIDNTYDNPAPPQEAGTCANTLGDCPNRGKIPAKMMSTPIDQTGRTFCSWECYSILNPGGMLGVR